MAYQDIVRSESFKVATGLTRAAQFKIVELTANVHEVEIAGIGAGYGVLQNHPENAGEHATVATEGITKVVAGSGGLAIKDWVMSAASGYATKATLLTGSLGAGTPRNIIGRALTSAASGGLAAVELQRGIALT